MYPSSNIENTALVQDSFTKKLINSLTSTDSSMTDKELESVMGSRRDNKFKNSKSDEIKAENNENGVDNDKNKNIKPYENKGDSNEDYSGEENKDKNLKAYESKGDTNVNNAGSEENKESMFTEHNDNNKDNFADPAEIKSTENSMHPNDEDHNHLSDEDHSHNLNDENYISNEKPIEQLHNGDSAINGNVESAVNGNVDVKPSESSNHHKFSQSLADEIDTEFHDGHEVKTDNAEERNFVEYQSYPNEYKSLDDDENKQNKKYKQPKDAYNIDTQLLNKELSAIREEDEKLGMFYVMN